MISSALKIHHDLRTEFYDYGVSPEVLSYYKRRKSVLFISYNRFWEKDGFIQQNLARWFTKQSIPVTWYDGKSRTRHQPVVDPSDALLRVEGLRELPFRRVQLFENLTNRSVARKLSRKIDKDKPLVWIQSGFPDAIVEKLPYVDVYSTFDDPYYGLTFREGPKKASVIACQNRFAQSNYEKVFGSKSVLLYPPVTREEERAKVRPLAIDLNCLNGYRRVFGYVGSFRYEHYDFNLLEQFVDRFKKDAFLFVGRTDQEGQRRIATFKKFKNFFFYPWLPREQLQAIWSRLDCLLLFYRPFANQYGAFPIKFIEALQYRLPILATSNPKTEDISAYSYQSNSFFDLAEQAEHLEGLARPTETDYYQWKHLLSVSHHLEVIGRALINRQHQQ